MTIYKRSRWEKQNPDPLPQKLKYILLIIAVSITLLALKYLLGQ